MVRSPLPAELRPRYIPARVFATSALSLSAPLFAAVLLPETLNPGLGVLIWLFPLLPAFLFAYYCGWKGVAIALVAGIASLILGQLAVFVLGREVHAGSMLPLVLLIHLGVALGVGWVSGLLHRERAAVEQLALTDELTQLPNRRYSRMFLETEFAAAQRGRSLVVVLFDLDHFKEYNDRHGHVAGDEALCVFARVLHSCTRRMNLSARQGGEEFLSIVTPRSRGHWCSSSVSAAACANPSPPPARSGSVPVWPRTCRE